MIRCFITSTEASIRLAEADGSTSAGLLKAACAGSSDVELVERPEDANLVIFAESHRLDDAMSEVMRHPTYLRHRDICVVHSGADRPEPRVPGLYPSIDRRWAEVLGCVGSPYLTKLNPYVGAIPEGTVPVDLMASFTGSSAPGSLRARLIEVAAAEGWTDIVVRNTHAEFVSSIRGGDTDAQERLRRRFAEDIHRARFALCPAGMGPSSFRIFEAMKASRAPVVIADAWCPPPGPDWNSFLIRVAERDIRRLPSILGEVSDSWEEKGQRAREAWERYFDPESFGPYIVKTSADVLRRANERPVARRLAALFYVGVRRRGERAFAMSKAAARKLRSRVSGGARAAWHDVRRQG